jgi:hypothetical protein
VDSPGDPVPVLVAPFDIADGIPTEGEIEAAVKRLQPGKAPGPTGMRSDDLKVWLLAAWREETLDGTNWCLLAELIQEIFHSGVFPMELPWSTLVLIPKDSGGCWGIGLLEVVWKVIAAIMDEWMKASIEFHDVLHGFLAKWGTGTAIIEAKLLQQMAAIEQVPLFEIFLDLKKAYNTLDCDQTLGILKGYGMGPCLRGILQTFWDLQHVVAKQGGYFGDPFGVGQGFIQGGLESPIIFNVVCNAVICYWLSIITDDNSIPVEGFGLCITEQGVLLYVDDGLLASRDVGWLQQALDVLVDLFACMGLKTNTTKTQSMMCTPGYIHTHQSVLTYNQWTGGGGESYWE